MHKLDEFTHKFSASRLFYLHDLTEMTTFAAYELESIDIKLSSGTGTPPSGTARHPHRVQARLRPTDFLGSFSPTAEQDTGLSPARQRLRTQPPDPLARSGIGGHVVRK